MQLPNTKDPRGDLMGSVPLDDVLRVLHDHYVSIHKQKGDETKLETEHDVQVQLFTDPVPGLHVRYLSRVFDIPITDFYHTGKAIH